ncbi:MAG: ABC transporter permease [Candidatus Dactylopiibacterium sp.]|nr:ABC transporter permease [Candidatus Dactylopiibacterium sp.]
MSSVSEGHGPDIPVQHGLRRGDAAARSPLAVTLSVWRALMLREALTRLFSKRAAWAWLMAEPLFHISYMLAIFTGLRARTMGGIDIVIWLISGMCAFFIFRRTANQLEHAIDANMALFAYRQVKPVDTVIVRGVLEGILMLVVSLIIFGAAGLWGHDILPDAPLMVAAGVLGLWLIGLGWGLITSVLTSLISEMSMLLGFVMMPLFLLSGVFMPVSSIPQPYRDWVVLNPIVHGLEAVRLGFTPYYHAIPEFDLGYLFLWALGMNFMGLVLQRRFAERLVQQ